MSSDSPTLLEHFILVKELVYPDTVHRFYFVGPDEGYSAMLSIAYRFSYDGDCSVALKELIDFHTDIELHLLKAPAAVRSIRLYPQALHPEFNV
jgi:hypothetical protein